MLLSEKIKFDEFDGSHYCWKFQDELLLEIMSGIEKQSRNAFGAVASGFPGKGCHEK